VGTLHGDALMKALSGIALDVQRARTYQDVFKAAGEGLWPLDMSLSVMRMDGALTRMMYANLRPELRARLGINLQFEGMVVPQSRLPEALAAGKPIVIDDVSKDLTSFYAKHVPDMTGKVPQMLTSASYGRLVMAPVYANGQPWGGLTIGSNELRDEDIAPVTLFAMHVASAIEVAESIDRLEQRSRELDAVHAIATARLTPDATEQTRLLLYTIAEATRSSAGGIYLYDAEAQEYELLNPPFGVNPELLAGWHRFKLPPETFSLRTRHISELADSRVMIEKAGFNWFATVPIMQDGKPRALLSLGRAANQGYTATELRTAEILGVQVVALVERARLYTQVSQRVRQLSLLFELARAGTTLREEGALIDRLLGLLIDHIPCDAATMMYARGARLELGRYRAREGSGLPSTIALGQIPFDDSSIPGRAMRYQKAMKVSVEDAPTLTRQEMEAFGARFLMAAPLIVGEQHFGALIVGRLTETAFTDDDLKLMESCAAQVSVLLEHVKLFEDLRQSYRHLEHAQAELVRHERLAALGELAAVMAHEVRNPLGVIFNSLTTLKKRTASSPDAALLLGIVGEEADRLNRIVGDLLDFARPYEAERAPIELEPVVASAIDAATKATTAQCKVVTKFDGELPRFVVDGHLVRQALINLVMNAIQAMPKGGTVTVTVSADSREGQSLARIEVADEGIGISPQTEKHMFQPFFTTKATGTGLGLAVVKRIVDAHHGEISVRSAMGGGTTFTVMLPSSP
jgi:signal transduction histidine kinase